jgi:hypothetical protein
MVNWKFLTLRDLNSDRSVVQPVASRYTDWATAVHVLIYISFDIQFYKIQEGVILEQLSE